jgi:hypothetical protein
MDWWAYKEAAGEESSKEDQITLLLKQAALVQ